MEMPELLGALCRELPGLRSAARDLGEGPAMEELLAAARRGEPVEDRLRALGLLDPLGPDRPGTGRNVPGQSGGALVPVHGVDASGHVAPGHYRCPVDICSRVERPRPGDDLPLCALHGRPLRFG
ncbi:hypothetical protein ACIPSE_16900 [Streptomyces sp. NPDC090106]|uniref:hypothetical protein n=1 Tax=Streptomyces sp. NPDC090106 TaxID=3365946 RepID=UPI003812A5B0